MQHMIGPLDKGTSTFSFVDFYVLPEEGDEDEQ